MIDDDPIHSTLETYRIKCGGVPTNVVVYDESLREHFPHLEGRAQVYAKGPNSLAIAISSAATRTDCEGCVLAVMEALNLEFDENSELHQKIVKDLGARFFGYAQSYGKEDNGHD